MKVQLLDLARQYRKIRKEVLEEAKKVFDSQHYVLGMNVSALESEIAAYCGARFAVGVASGTDAILLSLMAAGVGPGDKVITSPFTFFATASSIARLGAVPVFVDIDPMTYNIDPGSIEACLRKSRKDVKAIIPVHLYGQCAEMDGIRAIARKFRIKVVEDAAQSIGASYKGAMACTLGDIGCLSFYPTKNLGGFGDGGMVVTNDEGLAESVRMLRVHGSRKRYYHEAIGVNSRLDELQAAALRVKLRRLAGWTEKRVENAGRYGTLFGKMGQPEEVTLPHVGAGQRPVFNQYVIRVRKRDELREHLSGLGIGTEIYYPMPLHLQKCFRYLGYRSGDFPVSERAAKEVLALPIYPELKATEQRHVVSSIIKFYGK